MHSLCPRSSESTHNRLEIKASFPTESLRRQISFLFDEPIPKPGMQGRKDPVLQDAAWALNWAGASQAATAA